MAVVEKRRAAPAAPGFSDASLVLREVVVRGDIHVDLALPPTAPATVAPWIFFLYERGSFAPYSFVDAMQRRGVAVATIALDASADGAAIASIVRELQSRAATYGLGEGMILAGDRQGASIAARVALDPGLAPSSLRGVVTFNGSFGDDGTLPRATKVPFLVLSAHGDTPDTARGSRRFARSLQRAGATRVYRHHVSARDERSLTDLSGERNEIADLVSAFVRNQPPPGGPDSAWAIDDVWSAPPPLSSEPFHEDVVVRRKAVEQDLRSHIAALFGESAGDLEPWPLATYDAIDIDAYLTAHPELGSGEWLTVENARGERLVFARAELRQRKAELVVGLDDEPNLFRLFVTYNVYRTYSWKPETGTRRLLIRPVGAFLHFPGENAVSATHAEFALTTASFHVTREDPWGTARQRASRVAGVLTDDQGCLQCHAFGAGGARAHHLRAADAATAEAFALPLGEYPPDVMKSFLFDQARVADDFGVGPLRVEPVVANELMLAVAEQPGRDRLHR